MTAQVAKRPEPKGKAKPIKPEPRTGHDKAINQLQKEIRILNEALSDMRVRQDRQLVLVTLPQELYFRVTGYLADYVHDTGESASLSDIIGDALEVYLWSEEQNGRTDAEEKLAE